MLDIVVVQQAIGQNKSPEIQAKLVAMQKQLASPPAGGTTNVSQAVTQKTPIKTPIKASQSVLTPKANPPQV